jgi:hypothetical protein
MKYLVTKSHRPETAQPIIAKKGEQFKWERKQTIWDGWLWCMSADGNNGWIPESWLSLKGKKAILRRDYDATELSVNPGETINGELIESGWLWSTNAKNQSGWIPLRCLMRL